jgi:hypothetical protein
MMRFWQDAVREAAPDAIKKLDAELLLEIADLSREG